MMKFVDKFALKLLLTVSCIQWFHPALFSQKKYTVTYLLSGKDTSVRRDQLNLATAFSGETEAATYIATLPAGLLARGYPAASVDSVGRDSLGATVHLYLGERYHWDRIATDSVDPQLLQNTGWNLKRLRNKPLDFDRLHAQEERILDFYGDAGYPFAQVFLDHVEIDGDSLNGTLIVRKGPLYHIDSIRVYGKVKIRSGFLQHYLDLPDGSIYDHEKLQKISNRLKQLPYLQEVQPWDITMLGSGSILNLYLQPKKSSEINVIVGYLPSNTVTGKSQVTGDVHLDLKNALGAGENILVNWQQLQPQSPRLDLGFSQPYVLHSKFGLDGSFDLLKKDSSYLQLNGTLGIQYLLSASKTVKVFYQNVRSYLLSGGFDTNYIIRYKVLPPIIDVGSGNFGISYSLNNTNYRLNPRSGNELDITGTAGLRKVSKNNTIANLKDPNDSTFDFNALYDTIRMKSYRFRVTGDVAHYFPIGSSSTCKVAMNAGWFQSQQNFQNELFQIGGYKLLRGFDEESIYADRYAVFTLEYRYLIGLNSNIYGFSDVGLTHTQYISARYSNRFASVGIGLEFETKFGLLNLSYAIGDRNDIKFDIRNASKIHIGYINYF